MTEVILFFGVPCQHNVELVRAYANERGAEFINFAAIMSSLPSGARSRYMIARDLAAHRVADRTKESSVVIALTMAATWTELTSFVGASLRGISDRNGVTLVFLESFCETFTQVTPPIVDELKRLQLGEAHHRMAIHVKKVARRRGLNYQSLGAH